MRRVLYALAGLSFLLASPVSCTLGLAGVMSQGQHSDMTVDQLTATRSVVLLAVGMTALVVSVVLFGASIRPPLDKE